MFAYTYMLILNTSYFCYFFGFFRAYLFARSLFGEKLSTPTPEARPDTALYSSSTYFIYSTRLKCTSWGLRISGSVFGRTYE